MPQASPPQLQSATGARFERWTAYARNPLWIAGVAFAVRLGVILLAHTYKFKAYDNGFSFGWEMGRIGRALAIGRGFADPFDGQTGPTAWECPLYPYLIAGVFKVAGVYTNASAILLLSINSVFAALTCIPIFLVAKKCFGESVAAWSAWVWALLPSMIYWSTRWVWETSLAALLMTLIFWLTLKLEDLEGAQPWVGFGVLWGVAALTNLSLLSFLPASGLWAWYRRFKKKRNSLAGVALASLFFLATISPWVMRNYKTFNKFIFIRSNFGAELRLGNGPGADGTWMAYVHPSQNLTEFRRYQQLGEIGYVEARKHEALEFIRADYGRFAWLSFKRFIYYWSGPPRTGRNAELAELQNSLFLVLSALAFWGVARAVRQWRPGAWLFLWLLLSYPTIYYFVFPHPRYRHPIEPEMIILAVFVISQVELRRKKDAVSSMTAQD